jgi:hypothetical protein
LTPAGRLPICLLILLILYNICQATTLLPHDMLV